MTIRLTLQIIVRLQEMDGALLPAQSLLTRALLHSPFASNELLN